MKNIRLRILSLIGLLVFSITSFALPFNITPASSLPKFIVPNGQIIAAYIVANNTVSQRNNNFVKYLPPNVSVFKGQGCSNVFNLAPRGQPGSSCTLFLKVTGPVDAHDPNPHHHLFVCFPGGTTCAGTRSPLNVALSNNLQKMAYIANNDGLNTIAICRVLSNRNLGKCVKHADSTFVSPIDIILNSRGTIAYVANGGSGNTISVCPVNANGSLRPCTAVAATGVDFAGLTLNFSNTLLYYTDFNNNMVHICNINANGSIGSCAASPTAFDGPTGRVSFNNANTIIYVANFNSATVAFCNVNSAGMINNCQNFSDPAVDGSLGTAINVANTFLYLPVFTLGASTVAVCPINANGSMSNPCTPDNGNGTFDFSDFQAINIDFSANPVTAYIPNGGSGSPGNISICPFLANGLFGTCSVFTDPSLSSPDSIYIATLGQFG